MSVAGESVERKSSLWRFSLREAVLALVGIGLLGALLVDHQPWTKAFWSTNFLGSEFLNELTEFTDSREAFITPICNRLVSKGKAECSGDYSGIVGPDNMAHLSASFRLRTPGVRPAVVVGEFRREVEKRLTKLGFSFAGAHPTYDRDDNLGFNVRYKKGRIRGFLYVYPFASDGFDPEKDPWRMEVVVVEHHRGGYFGW
jgi:hypothetical protein